MDSSQLRSLEKQYRVRVKTGCKTCRSRRVKCDEGRPHCNRCTNSGRQCEGYTVDRLSPAAAAASQRNSGFLVVRQRSSNPPPVDRSQSSTTQKGTVITRRSPPLERSPPRDIIAWTLSLSPFADPAEARSFEYFRVETLRENRLYDPNEFWGTKVLQLAQHEPAIRYGLLAISSLHECFDAEQSLALGEKGHFALKQYTIAIEFSKVLLAKQSKTKDHFDVVLIACVIFVCYENVLGNFALAAMHLNNGRNILFQRNLEQDPQAKRTGNFVMHDNEPLPSLFSILDVQWMCFTDAITVYPYDTIPEILAPPIPATFDSIAAATHHLTELCRHTFYTAAMQEMCGADSLQFQKHLEHANTAIDAWFATFGELEKSLAARISEDTHLRATITLLRIWSLVVTVLRSQLPIGDGDVLWDSCYKDFTEIVDLAQTLPSFVALSITDINCKVTQFSAMPLLAPSMPLFLAAHRCRDPLLRRRAIAILMIHRRRDGTWDTYGAARVAAEVIRYEERLPADFDLCAAIYKQGVEATLSPGVRRMEDVPAERRVVEVEIERLFMDRDRLEYWFKCGDGSVTARTMLHFGTCR